VQKCLLLIRQTTRAPSLAGELIPLVAHATAARAWRASPQFRPREPDVALRLGVGLAQRERVLVWHALRIPEHVAQLLLSGGFAAMIDLARVVRLLSGHPGGQGDSL
jgi:hypothetical protein